MYIIGLYDIITSEVVMEDIMKILKKSINKSPKKRKLKKKKNIRTINKKYRENSRDVKDIIEKRYTFLIILIVISFSLIILRLFSLQVLKVNEYKIELAASVETTIESTSAPRGRIYDRNYNLLVDNEAIKTIYYKKMSNIKTSEELELSYTISQIIELDYSKLSDYNLKNYWYLSNEDEGKNKITDKEWILYKHRELDMNDIKKLIFERITEEELTTINKEAAYIYYLMNKGYSYAEKIIKNKGVTEEEYAVISENIDSLKGFNTKLDWERIYLYGDTFKTILGSVSSNNQGIPSELADYYIASGYSLDDRVGISYLEYQYENYLKGKKAKYKVLSGNNYELVSQGTRGNDIVLTIDINLQNYLENMLASEVLRAKYEPNTDYYNRSFVVISDPNTGEILAMSGKQVKNREDGSLYVVDYTPGVATLSITPGSVVKGASMIVGYKYGVIDIGSRLLDECIKIKSTPIKCSWRTMGYIDDIYALEYSSNVYQYKIAMMVGGATYHYNQGLSIDTSAFDKYRNMYASFGLGVKTGIDLPVESLGYMGTSTLPGHLLDFSIGQYDTYTPIQLSQYINTLANGGSKLKPYLLKEVYAPSEQNLEKFGDLIYQAKIDILGTIDIDKKYIDRVRYSLSRVISTGIGYGFMGYYTNSSGKTGTSQSFIDTDGNGVVDTETITSSFVGYSPSENPKMSVVVVSPDISHSYGRYEYSSAITRRISAQIVNKFFEIYK